MLHHEQQTIVVKIAQVLGAGVQADAENLPLY